MSTLPSIPLTPHQHLKVHTQFPLLIFPYSPPLILINGLKPSTTSRKLVKTGDFSCDIMSAYCEKSREVAKKLLGGISEILGLNKRFLDKALDMGSGFQIFIANYYPRCPQPELALGMPPHSDHGLLTLFIQNQVGGLQVQHQGKWIHVNALPNSLLVNTGDHLEIFSNGEYKSNVHRAVVNNTSPRISVAVAHGPSLETIVSPASPLVKSESSTPAYVPMKYKDCMELQQSTNFTRSPSWNKSRFRGAEVSISSAGELYIVMLLSLMDKVFCKLLRKYLCNKVGNRMDFIFSLGRKLDVL